jgi:hypothetical protein
MKKEIKKEKRNCVWAELKQFDVLTKEGAFIEITQWTNGDGADINVSAHSNRFISLTWGEINAIKKLTKLLLKE